MGGARRRPAHSCRVGSGLPRRGRCGPFVPLQSAAAAGLVWDAATLDRFLSDPEAVLAGTAMSIPSVRDGEERAHLVAILSASASIAPKVQGPQDGWRDNKRGKRAR
jgi:cytochrome c